jgi:hypothetical protein
MKAPQPSAAIWRRHPDAGQVRAKLKGHNRSARSTRRQATLLILSPVMVAAATVATIPGTSVEVSCPSAGVRYNDDQHGRLA